MKLECNCKNWAEKATLIDNALEQASAGEMTLEDLGPLYCLWCGSPLKIVTYRQAKAVGLTAGYPYEGEEIQE